MSVRMVAVAGLVVIAIIVGTSIGSGIGTLVTGTWFARAVMQPAGFTVSSAGAGTGEELLEPEEPKEASPPTAVAVTPVPPPSPTLVPEEEISPVVVVPVALAPTPEPVVVVPAPIEPEGPWVNILPKEDFLRGEAFRRFAPFMGKTYETWAVAFTPKPSTQIRTPFSGRISTTARTVIDGKSYPTISIEGVLEDGRKFLFFIVSSSVRPYSGAIVEQWGVIAETQNTTLAFENRYSVLIGIGIEREVDSFTLFLDDLHLLKQLFPHVSF